LVPLVDCGDASARGALEPLALGGLHFAERLRAAAAAGRGLCGGVERGAWPPRAGGRAGGRDLVLAGEPVDVAAALVARALPVVPRALARVRLDGRAHEAPEEPRPTG
jgi:hypothetical protein